MSVCERKKIPRNVNRCDPWGDCSYFSVFTNSHSEHAVTFYLEKNWPVAAACWAGEAVPWGWARCCWHRTAHSPGHCSRAEMRLLDESVLRTLRTKETMPPRPSMESQPGEETHACKTAKSICFTVSAAAAVQGSGPGMSLTRPAWSWGDCAAPRVPC